MPDRFAGYDVVAKRDGPTWNEQTRRAIDERQALIVPEGVLSLARLATLRRVIQRICPDPPGRPPTTTLEMVAGKIGDDGRDGFRHHELPGTRECWQRGLDAIEGEAQARYATAFAALKDSDADLVLRAVEHGDVRAAEWENLPPGLFWSYRLIPDLVSAHWSQPSLWSAMGFGGPASPRGYVRLGRNRRDPWEAIEEGAPLQGVPVHRD